MKGRRKEKIILKGKGVKEGRKEGMKEVRTCVHVYMYGDGSGGSGGGGAGGGDGGGSDGGGGEVFSNCGYIIDDWTNAYHRKTN